MNFTPFLSPCDEPRARRTLEALRRHATHRWVLTGGMAIELHMLRHGCATSSRPLNDLDFLVNTFDEIPPTLSDDLLFRHVHPLDPPAKTLLQAVNPQTKVRVDVFRAYGDIVSRAVPVELYGSEMPVISGEDVAARCARLCIGLATGEQVPAKRARDFLRLLRLTSRSKIEPIWQEHRKANHPHSFREVAALLRDLFIARQELLTTPQYSQDLHAHCARCVHSAYFPLASAARIHSLLGYC